MKENKFDKAIEHARRPMERAGSEDEGPVHFYVPCGSGRHKGHTVVVAGDRITCDCEARVICYHILSSIGRPVAQFAMQSRWAEDQETLREVVKYYAESLRYLPLPLREIERAEYLAACRRLGIEEQFSQAA